MQTLLADRIDPPLVPGSPAWRREITASKVSALLGLSPWQSRFALYYDLAGQLPHNDDQTPSQSRGHYLEPAIADWLADELGLHLRPGGCWRSRTNPWMVASPDRLAYPTRHARRPVACVEIKTSGEYEGWGRDGSDDIPPHYRAQVMFQMDTLGLRTTHVGVLLPRLNFRAYVIRHDPEEAAWMRQEVLNFLDTLPSGRNPTPPDIDEHDATYEAVRRLHPELDDRDVEVDLDLAARFVNTVRDSAEIQSAETAVKSELALAMGTANRAVLPRPGSDPVVIARRQAKGSGTPFVVAKRPLPVLPELEIL